MENLSNKLQLSKCYTKGVIRSICVRMVTALKENDFPIIDIAAVTGNKNPNSVERCERK